MSTRSQHSRRGIGFNRSQGEREARRLLLQGAHESGTGTRRHFSDLSRSFDALNLTNNSPLALSPHRSGVDEGDDSDELENIDHKPSAGVENHRNHPPSTNQDDDPPKDVEPRRKCPWPVPHIIVDYQGVKYAWGRTILQKVGAKGARELFAKSYFRYAGPPNGNLADVRVRRRLMQEFETNLRLKASLYYTHGSGDDDLVILHPVGWEEVLQNVKEIYVIPPSQGAPRTVQDS